MKNNNNFPFINLDTNKLGSILSENIEIRKSISYLGKIDDLKPNPNTLTFANNLEYYLKAQEKGFDFILYNQHIDENDSTIFSKNPHKDFLKVVKWLNKNGEYSRLKRSVSKKVAIGENVKIGNNVVINDGVKIGNNVVIEDNSYIDKNVVIDDFVKIGGFGFDFAIDDQIQLAGLHGGVYIGENSIVKSFTNIDGSLWGLNTMIGSNVAIDSHVLIGHDVSIENNVQIRGGSIIGGFSQIGENSIVGIGSKFLQRTKLGKNSLTSANAIISKNYKENSKIVSQPSKVFKND